MNYLRSRRKGKKSRRRKAYIPLIEGKRGLERKWGQGFRACISSFFGPGKICVNLAMSSLGPAVNNIFGRKKERNKEKTIGLIE